MLFAVVLALCCFAAVTESSIDPCTYTPHNNISYLGNNVIECVDGEGQQACQLRCSYDPFCTNYGIYEVAPAGHAQLTFGHISLFN